MAAYVPAVSFKDLGLALAMLGAGGVAFSAVVFDGTLGPVGSLSGDFEISDAFGTQLGANLFHSFETFNVNTGESATFTSAFMGVTDHVIGRVTGGNLTTIDGVVTSTIPGADLWLVNPAGLVLGDNASLDVLGGFHLSTADYLLLEDGGRFYATDHGNTQLSVAGPTAFGFIDTNVSALSVAAATLDVSAGETVSLIGGDLSLSSTTLTAPGGRINLASASDAGTLTLTPSGISTTDLGVFGDISLATADVITTGDSGGDVYIRGGSFVMDASSFVTANTEGVDPMDRGGDIVVDANAASILNGSQFSSTTFGAGNGGRVALTVTGDVLIEGSVDGTPAGIFANVRDTSSGNGGNVEIVAENVSVLQGGLIGAVTFGEGNAGNINLDVVDTVTIRKVEGFDGAIFLNSLPSATGGVGSIEVHASNLVMADDGQLQANTFNGPSGNVVIDVDRLDMSGGSQIAAATWGAGPGGSVIVNAADISLTGLDANGFPTGIFANSNFPSTNQGGQLVVNTRTLSIVGGANLSAAAGGFGPAGSIAVNASESIFIDGADLLFPLFTGIFANTFGNGDAGSISVTTPELVLRQGGFVQSGSFSFDPSATGTGGNIVVEVDNLRVDAAFLSVRTETSGDGGVLVVNATDTITLSNSTGFVFTPGAGQPIGGLLTSAGGIFNSPQATGSAGDMTVNTRSLIVRDGGVLTADTLLTGNAGSITVNADVIDLFGETSPLTGIFDSSRNVGQGGSIFLSANELYVRGFASIVAGAFGEGDAGAIGIQSDMVSVTSGGSIVSSTFAAGMGGEIGIEADTITVADEGLITAGTSAGGDGGSLLIDGRIVEILSSGVVSAGSTGTGNAGTVIVVADEALNLDGGTIQTNSESSAGGNIDLQVGHTLMLDDGSISAAAGGVTPEDDGGNVTIDPEFVILRNSDVLANANAGNGGNISIRAGTFVIDANSAIDASSTRGLDGNIAIDSPNEVTGNVIPLDAPTAPAPDLLAQRCVPQLESERSTLTADVNTRGQAAPGDFLPSPLARVTQAVADADAGSGAAETVLALDRSSASCFGAM